MKTLVVVLVLGMLAGCSNKPQTVVTELTPLEEYNIACEVLDRDSAVLDEFKSLGPHDADGLKFIANMEETLKLERQVKRDSYKRLKDSITKPH